MSDPPSLIPFGDYRRSQLLRTAGRSLVVVVALLVVYYLVPAASERNGQVVLRLGVGMALFAAVVVYEVRAILTAKEPTLRATVAMATIIPFFLVIFAWVYFTLDKSQPSAFGAHLTRSSCLYFTVTVFSTVGFGDITPKTDLARLLVTVQMLLDLAVIAAVVRLVFGAATRGRERKEQEMEAIEEHVPSGEGGSP